MLLKLRKWTFKFIRDVNDNIYDNLPQWTWIAQPAKDMFRAGRIQGY